MRPLLLTPLHTALRAVQLPTDVDVESLVRRAQVNSAIDVAKGALLL